MTFRGTGHTLARFVQHITLAAISVTTIVVNKVLVLSFVVAADTGVTLAL